MNKGHLPRKAHREERLPTDVYLSFVRSLHANRTTIVVGIISHTVVAAAIYLKLQDLAFLGFAAAFIAIGSFRLWLMSRFDAALFDEQDYDAAWRWEMRYLFGISLISLALGLMAAYSVVATRDYFAQISSLGILMAVMISVVGRNYGSRMAVDVMCVLLFGPTAVGVFLVGDRYWILLFFLLAPLVWTSRTMANGVRNFLYEAVLGKRQISVMADRLDAALNNMSHGLVMLDADRTILVANRRAASLFDFADPEMARGRTLAVLFRYAVARRKISAELAEHILNAIDELFAGNQSRSLVRVSDDLYLEFSARRRDNGGVVLIFENVTARIKADEKIAYLARYDSLTGLPNRYHFADLVRTEIAQTAADDLVAVAVIDIDDFKHVNDTLGHLAGDRLLCEIAARLKTIDPERVIPSRFGGDEFVLLIRHVETSEDVSRIMSRIFDQLCGIYSIRGNRMYAGVSAGVVQSRRSGFVLDELQVKADLALHEAKDRDKNTWVVFADSMDEKYRLRQILKNDLRRAIEDKRLTLVYQPMFATEGLKLSICEALSRWEHEVYGPISPGEYIPLAEEMGIVPLITQYMLESACRDCARWPGELRVSVNLSALDLRNREIVGYVVDALQRSGLSAERLEVEVTESAFVEDAVKARDVLNELKTLGVTIAIDDFGTGYSNLSYLNSLPVTKVKIDRSFVRASTASHKNRKLLSGIVHLAREMDLVVTVEGVETEEEFEAVRSTGQVHLVQGFLFGRPIPQSGVMELASKTQATLQKKTAYQLRAGS
jgi:diguanylate cyclase (GGDEF)-like protein